jgi:hypothetical protein
LNVAFYFDEHIPRAVALGLRIRGVDVITAQDDDRRGIADSLLLDRATELRRPLFSHDRDLLIEAQRRQKAGIFFAEAVMSGEMDKGRMAVPWATLLLLRPKLGLSSQEVASRSGGWATPTYPARKWASRGRVWIH